MKLNVVIVNYNVKYYVAQCLTSLQRALKGIDAEVWVVDNHSADGSVDYLRARFPQVHVVACKHNLGFARANNIALRNGQSEYVLLLNPDTVVSENSIAEALRFMDAHPKAGGLGVRMMNAAGADARESRRGLPDPLTAFYKMTGLCARFPSNHVLGHYYMGWLPWNEASQIEVISGACFMLRRSALTEIGLLDEDFFMYGEDIDLSYRLLKKGYENWYLPVRVLHYKGESTQKSSFRYVHVFYEAMLIFFRKHYGHMSFLLGIPIKTAIYVKAFIAFSGMQMLRLRKSLGFFTPYHEEELSYCFLVADAARPECERIAMDNGVEAHFYACDSKVLANGHRDLALPKGRKVCIVYDNSLFSYGKALDIFGSYYQPNIEVGFYDSSTQMVITQQGILK